MAAFDPARGSVLVPDLGLDLLLSYELTSEGTLIEDRAARLAFSVGTGPRHVSYHPDGEHLFLVAELSNKLFLLRRRATGGFEILDERPATGARQPAATAPAAVRLSSDGEQVFVTNREMGGGHVTVFGHDLRAGRLRPQSSVPTGGTWPRDCVLTPDGGHLVVANQVPGSVAVLELGRGPTSPKWAGSVAVASPACLLAD